MNPKENSERRTSVAIGPIPKKLHCYRFQKLMFKHKSSPFITKNSVCSRAFQMVIPNRLNRNLKKVSNKIFKNLRFNRPLSTFYFRYAFSNIKEITFVAEGIKYLRRITSLQLQIMNDSTSLESFNELVRSLRFLPALKSLSFDVTYQNSPSIKEFKLTKTLQYLKNLDNLSLDFARGGVLDLEKICQGLQDLTNLKTLTLFLSFSGIVNKDTHALAQCLVYLKQLKCFGLDLSSNSLSLDGLDAILKGIQQLTQLRFLELSVSKNLILAEEFSKFNECMQTLTHLEVLKLNLSGIKIFEKSLKDFGDGLGHLNTLKVLKLTLIDCFLNKKNLANLANGISKLVSLTEIDIDLTNNQLNNKETSEFIEYLRPLKKLQKFSLSLARNLIGDWVLFSLSKAISNYHDLEKIDLDGFSCKFSDKGIEYLRMFLADVPNLKELTLIFNRNIEIQDGGVKEFMDKLVEKRNLKEVRIDFAECKVSQDLEDFYVEKFKKDLPDCHTTLLFNC